MRIIDIENDNLRRAVIVATTPALFVVLAIAFVLFVLWDMAVAFGGTGREAYDIASDIVDDAREIWAGR